MDDGSDEKNVNFLNRNQTIVQVPRAENKITPIPREGFLPRQRDRIFVEIPRKW
jgi:hypothetical protein